MLRNSLRYCLALGVLLAAAAVARTQTTAALGQPQPKGPPQPAQQDMNADLLKARMDRLERQNLELMQQLQRLQMTPTAPPIAPQTSPQAQSPAAPVSGDGGVGEDKVKKLILDREKEIADKKKADDEAAKRKLEEEAMVFSSSQDLHDGLILDGTFYLLKVLSWFGIVWDLRYPSQAIMNAARSS